MSALTDLDEYLDEDEGVEAIIFGNYGYGQDTDKTLSAIQPKYRGKILSFEVAKTMMETWSFQNGFGIQKCYATYIWTNRRVIWVSEYDGSTCLNSMPRNPIPCIPEMSCG